MSSFSKPFTENSLSRLLEHWLHWHRFHWHSVSVSARLNDTDTECQCSQCSSGLTDDRKVTVLQYLHWNCSSLFWPNDSSQTVESTSPNFWVRVKSESLENATRVDSSPNHDSDSPISVQITHFTKWNFCGKDRIILFLFVQSY